ncbi:MAG TPA: glycosyltransferase N-terminal domain-containing protein, partial [Candidatus Eisenbacteria bacterium]|nr:glycosyltransferase N-terminal domain-containing protein [Candidatus Eisenbacteria bacterium]
AAVLLYRLLTGAAGLLAPALSRLGRPDGAWRGSLTGRSDENARAAGSIWIHAASLGEMGVARTWAGALVESGVRPPLLVTARTSAGLTRARRELSGVAASRFAPADLPQVLRAFLDQASPFRIDIIETEIWPNLLVESRRSGVAVIFVGATVSPRTVRRLRALGVAGEPCFGGLVHALPKTEEDAARFHALGVPRERIRVVGDLKADEVIASGNVPDPARQGVVLFGSFRPGEEEAARSVAVALDALPGRPPLIVVPRHEEGRGLARRALTDAGFSVSERSEADRGATALANWMAALSARDGKRAGVLATKGELSEAYSLATMALIGGTFAPFGGHNALEAAARGCPIIVGPHHEEIEAAVLTLHREGASAIAKDAAEAARLAAAWLSDGRNRERSAGATRAAAMAGGATRRALDALSEWGLSP